jgi:hypothetical protein
MEPRLLGFLTAQCLSHIPELSTVFASGAYRKQLNRENPLGTQVAGSGFVVPLITTVVPQCCLDMRSQGEVADAFGKLVGELWSGQFTVLAPYDFRSVLVRHAEQFAGYQQHDSQVRSD